MPPGTNYNTASLCMMATIWGNTAHTSFWEKKDVLQLVTPSNGLTLLPDVLRENLCGAVRRDRSWWLHLTRTTKNYTLEIAVKLTQVHDLFWLISRPLKTCVHNWTVNMLTVIGKQRNQIIIWEGDIKASILYFLLWYGRDKSSEINNQWIRLLRVASQCIAGYEQ